MGDLIKICKDKKNFRIKAKTETEAEITIYAAIGNYWFEDSVSAKTFADELKELPKSIETINVRINSPGGDVFDGITIYNRLKQHKAKVVVYIDAIAASIASIIAMAGDEIVMGEGSQIMIHKPMTGIYGNSLEMQDVMDRLDDIEEQMLSIYQRRTGTDRAEIRAMVAKETWLDAETAVELGFANRIMANDEELKVAAYDVSKVSWIQNKAAIAGQTKEDLIKDKVGSALEGLEEFLDK